MKKLELELGYRLRIREGSYCPFVGNTKGYGDDSIGDIFLTTIGAIKPYKTTIDYELKRKYRTKQDKKFGLEGVISLEVKKIKHPKDTSKVRWSGFSKPAEGELKYELLDNSDKLKVGKKKLYLPKFRTYRIEFKDKDGKKEDLILYASADSIQLDVFKE